MKIFIIFAIVSMLVACSSAKKQSDSNQPQTNNLAPSVNESSKIAPKIDADLVKKEVCESGQDNRLLEVHKKATGCELSYTKFGRAKIVSSGKYGTKHCEDSFDKITKKLEAQKYSCHST